ncbi:hypothetical protein BaRGS_00005901 [Batillaria attramentaria]|uniref:Uncharacterized protein n=1 Tax=Batillaria attramentaria TaxID=370345 RepID=A0ABD0LTZ4_9CAEN
MKLIMYMMCQSQTAHRNHTLSLDTHSDRSRLVTVAHVSTSVSPIATLWGLSPLEQHRLAVVAIKPVANSKQPVVAFSSRRVREL